MFVCSRKSPEIWVAACTLVSLVPRSEQLDLLGFIAMRRLDGTCEYEIFWKS